MGVGKSAIGRGLAKSLKLDFLDTDDMLVAKQGLSINDIFLQYGEPYFRELESQLLTEIDYTKSQIIATGGGLPITGDNLESMKQKGIVVFLKDELEPIAARLFRGKHKRPAIKELNIEEIKYKLKSMLDIRTPIYSRSHLTFLRSDDLSKDINELVIYLKMYL